MRRPAAVGVVTQAAEEAAAFAAIGFADRNLAGYGPWNHLAAGDGFFVRNAHANRTGCLARHLALFVHRALLNALLFDAIDLANLDLFFLPDVPADRDFAMDGFGIAHLLAHGHGAFPIFRAVDPDVSRARAARLLATSVGGCAWIAAVVMAVATEQAAATEEWLDFLAFPVAQANELLLHAGFLDVLVAGLVDDAIFIHGLLVADLADFFGPDRNAIHHAHGAVLDDGHAFGSPGVVGFGSTFHLVGFPCRSVILTHPLRATHSAVCGGRRASARRSTGVTASGRPEISPCGRNRHGGNGANQQSETKRLAHHAFSLVIHADPVSPHGHIRWVRIDTGD